MRATIPGARLISPRPTRLRWRHSQTPPPRGAALVVGVVMVVAGCSDSRVPYFDAPTSVPNSTAGIQQVMSGLFAGTRSDASTYITLAASFGRDLFEFQGASPGSFGPPAGLNPLSSAGPLGVWDNEYEQIKE